jgi:integrase
MIEAMQLRGFSPRTHQAYLAQIQDLARYSHKAPDLLSEDELRAYFRHLVLERKLSSSSCWQAFNAVLFLFRQVLGQLSFRLEVPLPKRKQRIPELLTRAEVGLILGCCSNPKHRMLLATCYGCGLRVSELVHLLVSDIDGERHLLRINQGKGAKDRLVMMSPTLLQQLRDYWSLLRPDPWLFPGRFKGLAIGVTSVQKLYTDAKRRAGVRKAGGIHGLRHAYATHQLEAGLPIHRLQRQLGHSNLSSTLRYVHWVADYREGTEEQDLLAMLEVDHG